MQHKDDILKNPVTLQDVKKAFPVFEENPDRFFDQMMKLLYSLHVADSIRQEVFQLCYGTIQSLKTQDEMLNRAAEVELAKKELEKKLIGTERELASVQSRLERLINAQNFESIKLEPPSASLLQQQSEATKLRDAKKQAFQDLLQRLSALADVPSDLVDGMEDAFRDLDEDLSRTYKHTQVMEEKLEHQNKLNAHL